MTRKYHRDGSTPSASNAIFVFGSNEAGVHGAGAAKEALRFGAVMGLGRGFASSTYAIPTKDHYLQSLSLAHIEQNVKKFIQDAIDNPKCEFFVTRIGCGFAGYKDYHIAPMFRGAPSNCSFALEWAPYLESIQ